MISQRRRSRIYVRFLLPRRNPNCNKFNFWSSFNRSIVAKLALAQIPPPCNYNSTKECVEWGFSGKFMPHFDFSRRCFLRAPSRHAVHRAQHSSESERVTEHRWPQSPRPVRLLNLSLTWTIRGSTRSRLQSLQAMGFITRVWPLTSKVGSK